MALRIGIDIGGPFTGFLESGGGWIAPWLDRMDRHFEDQGFNDSGLTTKPSELFQRDCWISSR